MIHPFFSFSRLSFILLLRTFWVTSSVLADFSPPERSESWILNDNVFTVTKGEDSPDIVSNPTLITVVEFSSYLENNKT